MGFKPENCEDFKVLFYSVQPMIAAFPGCMHVELLRDKTNPDFFFTLSHWNSEKDLEAYRVSELFKDTWTKTKALFAHKPEAWSTEKVT